MPRFKIDMDEETYAQLLRKAQEDHRPAHLQAEWMLMQALREWAEKRAMQALPLTPPAAEEVRHEY